MFVSICGLSARPVVLTIHSPVKTADAMSDLKLHLHEVIAEPTGLVKQGTAPPPFFFALEPPARDGEETQKFAAVLGAAALARIFAGMNLVRSDEHTGGDDGDGDGDGDTPHHLNLNNPGEYVAAFNEKAEATMTAYRQGPLASMFRAPGGGSATSLDLEVTRADLRAMVLARVFDDLGQVSKTQVDEIDKVLTRFLLALRPFKVPSPSRGQTLPDLTHAVVVNYVKSIDITGTGSIYDHKAYTRIVLFSVKPQHWASALQKPGSYDDDQGPANAASGASGSSVATKASGGRGTPASSDSDSKKVEEKSGWFDWGGKPKPKPSPKGEEKIKFTLNSTVLELEFDDAKYVANKAKFEAVFKNIAEDDEALSDLVKKGGLTALGRETCTVFPVAKA